MRAGRRYLASEFAPSGVYLATPVTRNAGALLPHRFTLTCAHIPQQRGSEPSAVSFLWHCPASHLDWPLASTVALWSPDLPQCCKQHCGHPANSPSWRGYLPSMPSSALHGLLLATTRHLVLPARLLIFSRLGDNHPETCRTQGVTPEGPFRRTSPTRPPRRQLWTPEC